MNIKQQTSKYVYIYIYLTSVLRYLLTFIDIYKLGFDFWNQNKMERIAFLQYGNQITFHCDYLGWKKKKGRENKCSHHIPVLKCSTWYLDKNTVLCQPSPLIGIILFFIDTVSKVFIFILVLFSSYKSFWLNTAC